MIIRVALLVGLIAAAPPIMTRSGPLAEPIAGMGQVVFYRPGSLVGRFLGCVIHDEATTVARLGSGKFAVVPLTPGTHRFGTHGRGAQGVEVKVGAGDTAYVECSFGRGVTTGAADLDASSEAAFVAAAPKLKRSGS